MIVIIIVVICFLSHIARRARFSLQASVWIKPLIIALPPCAMLDNVKHVILVMSGKGGVGKSTVSTQLAMAFRDAGHKVGLLDIDLCGPSIPLMLGLESSDVYQADGGWVPIYTDAEKRFGVMSIGFLLKNRNDAVIWRGPKKTAMIRQFLNDVQWGELDYLVIDTPPGECFFFGWFVVFVLVCCDRVSFRTTIRSRTRNQAPLTSTSPSWSA